jgi:hypothetical protein
MRKLVSALPLFALFTSGCLGCRDSYATSTIVGAQDATTADDASPGTTVGISHLATLDGNGRASGDWGDFVVSNANGMLFLNGHPLADAIAGTQADLRDTQGGTLLVGKHFDLDCSRQGDGTCLGYDAWANSSVTGSVDVIAAQGSPAPLLTLDVKATITAASATSIAHTILKLDLEEQQTLVGRTGDCS